jgi:hypothetical protein
LAELIDFLTEHDLDDRVAFTEIHNEVQVGHLADGLPSQPEERVVALRPRLERALELFHRHQPERPVTVNYARVPVGAMRGIPDTIDVLVTHPYVYGVLGAFIDAYGCGVGSRTSTKPAPSGTSCFPVHRSSPNGRPTSHGG